MYGIIYLATRCNRELSGTSHLRSFKQNHLTFIDHPVPVGNFIVQATLWRTDLPEQKYEFHGHSHAITEARFSPSMPQLATTSLDKTVRVWDVENVSYYITAS